MTFTRFAIPHNTMAPPTASSFIGLAKQLPAPLQRFFARWPPAAILPNNGVGVEPTEFQKLRPNPFAKQKNPRTGNWQDPVYSLRRQAELCKLAREHGVEHLLPESNKAFETKLARRVEHGLRVKGTGVGQHVKGHIHERHMIAKYVIRITMYSVAATDHSQDGEQERGYAEYAQAHQGVEEGEFPRVQSYETPC